MKTSSALISLSKVALLAINLIVVGCSLQHHTDKAERQWLRTNYFKPAMFTVALTGQLQNNNDAKVSFLTARSANTYLSGQIASPKITELSGLAPIQGVADSYWAINDSGNKSQVFAIDGGGQHLATFDLPFFNRDWEAIASYKMQDKSWLVIGEVGDNLHQHAMSSLYLFEQPQLASKQRDLKLSRRIDFSYPDGPQNVESMAVSVREQKIYLIGKNSKAAKIYTIPLNASGKTVANPVGKLAELHPTNDDKWWERVFASRILMSPTALDISTDDRLAVVANYRHVYIFRRDANESWANALARSPQILTTHRMEQSEAVSFSSGTDQVILGSEGLNAPLLTVRPMPLSRM